MKRQRNVQQVKAHDKCPPNQIKEEETGSLPEKEFRIVRVKMIQNLERSPIQPHPQRGTSTVKRNHKLPEYGKATQTQRYIQDERAEKYPAGKATG